MITQNQVTAEVSKQLENIDVSSLVNRTVLKSLDVIVSKLVKKTIESLLPEIHAMVIENVNTYIDTNTKMAVKAGMGHLDVKKIISEAVAQQLSINIKKYSFPDSSIPHSSINWTDAKFSGDMVTGGIIRQFQSSGIQDNATDCQLTIVDGVIVAEGHLISKEMQTDMIKTKHAVIAGELKVTGSLDLSDEASRTVSKLIQKVVDLNRKDKDVDMDLGEHSIMSNKSLILNKSTLGSSVINSNLRRLGLLLDLRVSGDTKLSETMTVTQGHKVGINTDEPVGALTIWDDDAELTVQKISRRNMYMGSTRTTDVSFGTNNRTQIRLRQDQVDISDPVNIMGIKFRASDSVPEGQGVPNEIVFVSNAKEGQPRLYICQGGSAWAAFR